MKVAIIKYNAGNIFSVECAMRRLGVESILTDDENIIRSADKVIFPGVGEAETTMNYLRSHGMDKLICSLTQPVLGICIGLQLMCKSSEEANNGKVECLGIFDTDVVRFSNKDFTTEQKVPHMGWNTVINCGSSPLLKGVDGDQYFYYVHSYRANVCNDTTAITKYEKPYSAILEKNNFHAVQFHPEKSGMIGEAILRNFLDL